MSGKGRPAALPPQGWQPPQRSPGLVLEFVSDDGGQRKAFDFGVLPGHPSVREELASAFSEVTGPLGRWRRLQSAERMWAVARRTNKWVAENRPTMSELGELTVADARMLLHALRTPAGHHPMSELRTLLSCCPAVKEEVLREIARHKNVGTKGGGHQPYTEQEWRWISTAMRTVIRRARERIVAHRQLVADFRAGKLDDRDTRDPERCLGEVLDHYLRTGDFPHATSNGFPTQSVRIASLVTGRPLRSLLHLSTGEAWAFGALLVGLTGLNPSTVFELPVPRILATAPHEPGVVFVDAIKHRRGPRAAMTIALTDLRTELHPPDHDRRPQHVRETSLTTPYGVFMSLLDLTESARHMVGSEKAFTFYVRATQTLTATTPKVRGEHRKSWFAEALTGDPERDDVLLGFSLNRLRKTHLERHRRPVAHTPATLGRYLRNMDTVTEEGYQLIREALDEQVADARKRRRMHVEALASLGSDHDTVIGACTDFDHSPHDGGATCRQTFLTCLDCSNARAFPRHLPFQLAVLDELQRQRDHVSALRWVTEFAGRVAQLEEIIAEFEPAQRTQARDQITDLHRRTAARLLTGDLDPI